MLMTAIEVENVVVYCIVNKLRVVYCIVNKLRVVYCIVICSGIHENLYDDFMILYFYC